MQVEVNISRRSLKNLDLGIFDCNPLSGRNMHLYPFDRVIIFCSRQHFKAMGAITILLGAISGNAGRIQAA